MTEEPGPYRTLMIGAVAMPWIAGVIWLVLGVVGRQRPQPIRGEQQRPADRHDLCLSLRRKRAVRQAYGKDLVGPDRAVVAGRAVEHIIETAGPFVGKLRKTGAHPFGKGAVKLCRAAQIYREGRHDAQRVIPQGIDLD